MREKFKELGLRLTELSDYLGFSRPTLYKYLDDYENKKYKNIDYKAKKVFDFIMRRSTLSKIKVINYIIGLNSEDNKTELDDLFQSIKKDTNLVDTLNQSIDALGIEQTISLIKKLIQEGDVKND